MWRGKTKTQHDNTALQLDEEPLEEITLAEMKSIIQKGELARMTRQNQSVGVQKAGDIKAIRPSTTTLKDKVDECP